MSGSDFGKGLLTFVCGAALGATLGILFAPDKGERTRKKIVKKSRDIKDSVTQKFEDLVDSAEEMVDEIKETAAEFMNRTEKSTEK